jgi:hypothetical protein
VGFVIFIYLAEGLNAKLKKPCSFLAELKDP